MEERVGQLWHKIITRAALTQYPEAAVCFKDLEKQLGIQFRAFGGERGLQLKSSTSVQWQHKRNFLSRVASNRTQVELAWVDGQSLHLPDKIDLFQNKYLNAQLYLWLTALAAHANRVSLDHGWITTSQYQVSHTLTQLPGLRSIYHQLVKSHIAQRPDIKYISPRLQTFEQAIRNGLLQPERLTGEMSGDPLHVLPVPLWLHPSPPAIPNLLPADSENTEVKSAKQTREIKKQRSKKAERVQDKEGREGLLAFRLESVFSWTEFIPVDRTADDDDEEHAEAAMNDLDVLSVTRTKDLPASTLKFDLDLPGEAQDHRVASSNILLPEWNYKKSELQVKHCALNIYHPQKSTNAELPARITAQSRRLKAKFEYMAMAKHWLRGLPEGAELDLNRFIMHQADKKRGQGNTETGLYQDIRQSFRDLSCLLLADLSLSTDAWVNDERRVIDVIRDTLHLFSEALSAINDRYAIAGFSSKRRDHIRYYPLKDFNQPLDAQVRRCINGIEPGYYTRMGAAIRYATICLEKQHSAQRLLLLLTDGKPNDIDIYEGRYGIEDTRHAIHEARRAGLSVFCITIDKDGNSYLPYLFGLQHYTVVRRASDLPQKLTKLYAQLTH